jgi:predicted site-specific integrase-resolvase
MKTIQKWDRLGILPTKRAITTHRYSTDSDLAAALDLPRLQKDRLIVDYCRVSGHAQKPD